MKEIGISPEDKVICFGQLFGMCDYLTFPLGKLKLLNLFFFYLYLLLIIMLFVDYFFQVNQDIQHSNIFLMDQSKKFYLTCLDEHKKTAVYLLKLKKKNVYYFLKSKDEFLLVNGFTNQRVIIHLCELLNIHFVFLHK